MACTNCQFLITDAGAPGLARRKAYNPTDVVELLDETTNDRLRMKAEDVPLFRYVLYVDGKPCRILGILK